MRRNGFDAAKNPILRTLDTIECRDAVLNADGSRAEWPIADVVVGNPPFLGGKKLRDELGSEYVEQLFTAYANNVPQEADLVTYWIAKAWQMLVAAKLKNVGLVATNSIRGGANRRVLMPIADANGLFIAWGDQPWTVDGAAVRVSLLAFAARPSLAPFLDGIAVERINADLTGTASDLTKSARLNSNVGIAFMGDTKGGAFDISGELARDWLTRPLNPNGRPNKDVLKPWVNGMDITRRPADKWIIDFGWVNGETEVSLYEAPFAYSAIHIEPLRRTNRRENYSKYWWRHMEPRPGMWKAMKSFDRIIVTPAVSKFRVFSWLSTSVCPDHALLVFTRDDDTCFGILHSTFHELWSLRMGTSLEDRPRYTPSTTFETFPFPEGLTPNIAAADYADDPRAIFIAAASARLNELREKWLNPADLVVRKPEVVAGYPDRILPRDEVAAKELAKRTLTNLYNARPAWLDNAHKALDEAVAEAYGWGDDWRTGLLTEDEILARLFRLNQERAKV
jgi:type II restriction/modification system DNA methylase subunit YeeA